ncbi:MAG: DUF7601 domain-containing protein [Christensenellales bacterium]
MKKLSRSLAVMLCLVLVISLIPATAFAANGLSWERAEWIYNRTDAFGHIDIRVRGDLKITTSVDGSQTGSQTKDVKVLTPVTITLTHANGKSETKTFNSGASYEWRWTRVSVGKQDTITISGRLQVEGEEKTYDFSKTYSGREDFIQAIIDCDGNQGLDFNIQAEELIEIVTPKGDLTITKTNIGATPSSVSMQVSGPDNYARTVVLSDENKWSATLENLALGTYTVEETERNTPAGFSCVTTINGVQADSTQVALGEGGATVAVCNTYTSTDAQEDPNFIVVQKTFSGITADQIPEDFTVTVRGGSAVYTLTEGSSEGVEFSKSADGLVWRWKIIGAQAGTYTVSESGMQIDRYEVASSGTGDVTVAAADIDAAVLTHETTCSHTNWPVSEGTFFAATLTQNRGVAVITEHSLSAAQRLAVQQVVLSIAGPWKSPVYFYSIEEQITSGAGFELNGATITYNFDTQEMLIGDTNQWQHVAQLSYDIQAAQNPEVALTNAYTPKTTQVAVEKRVSGNMGDRSQAFDFSVTCTGPMKPGEGYTLSADRKTAAFSLTHGQRAVLNGVPLGATLTVEETNGADYAATITAGGQTLTDGQYTVPDEGGDELVILVENRKDVLIDTGVHLDTLPYLLMLAMAAAGGAVLLRRARRRAQ